MLIAGVMRNLTFFANWNPLKDNAPRSRQSSRPSRNRQPAPKGAPFVHPDQAMTYANLRQTFPSLVDRAALDRVILQCGRNPPKDPLKGVRTANALNSKKNAAAINQNYNDLPRQLRNWIEKVQKAVGRHHNEAGYEEPEDKSAADHFENVMTYDSKSTKTLHYVMTADVTVNHTFLALENLPTPSFRACHVQLDKTFDLDQVPKMFERILALSGPEFVILVR